MYKRKISTVLSIIMLAVLLVGIVACDEEGSCGTPMSEEEKLQSDIKRINEMISSCCLESKIVTYEQLKVALASFYYMQERFSGSLLRKIDGVEYRCPKFALEWENMDSIEKENALYIITTLPKDANGLYKGIRVTPYFVTETAEKIKEMNAKFEQFLTFSTNKKVADDLAERFKEFQKEYSGKLLCVDPIKGEIRCPNYILDYREDTDHYYEYLTGDKPYVIVWKSHVLDKNDEGFIPGLMISNSCQVVPDDYTVKAGEIFYYWKTETVYPEHEYTKFGDRLLPYDRQVRVKVDKTKEP